MFVPDHPNDPAYNPQLRCEWDAVGDPECDRPVYDNEPLCEEHMMQAIEEDAAEVARKQQKEDETIWND